MVEQTMSNSSMVQQLDNSIKQATVNVEFGKAIERLRSNRDFKLVIGEGYFEREAIRLVHLKSDVAMQSVASQADIVKQMDAIGALQQFFNAKLHVARLATRAIEDDEETRQELLAEGVEE